MRKKIHVRTVCALAYDPKYILKKNTVLKLRGTND